MICLMCEEEVTNGIGGLQVHYCRCSKNQPLALSRNHNGDFLLLVDGKPAKVIAEHGSTLWNELIRRSEMQAPADALLEILNLPKKYPKDPIAQANESLRIAALAIANAGPPQEQIQHQAARLIKYAEAAGMVVTIHLKPLQPLAMGNHEMVAEVSPRHPY